MGREAPVMPPIRRGEDVDEEPWVGSVLGSLAGALMCARRRSWLGE